MQVVRPVTRREQEAGEPGRVRLLVAPAYEVLFMLAAAPHPRRHELARGWGAALQRRLSPAARATWRSLFDGDGAIGVEPARLVARLAPPRSVSDLLLLLRTLPPGDLALTFLGDAAADPALADVVSRLAGGGAPGAAAERVLSRGLAPLQPRRRAQLRHVLNDVEGTRRAYLTLLGEADAHILAPQWPTLGPLLESARADCARRHAASSPAGLVSTLARGRVDLPARDAARPLVVALSYHLYPAALLMEGPDDTLLVAGTRGQETAPDPGTLRVLKALSDATRLRIVELLAERPRYVQELADVLDVRHPTVIHHLTVLREAALIASDDDGATTYYTLRPATLDAVMAHLRRRLHLPDTASGG